MGFYSGNLLAFELLTRYLYSKGMTVENSDGEPFRTGDADVRANFTGWEILAAD